MRPALPLLLVPFCLLGVGCSAGPDTTDEGLESDLAGLEPGAQERGAAREPDPAGPDTRPAPAPGNSAPIIRADSNDLPDPPPQSQSIRTVAIVNDQTLTSLEVERVALGMAMSAQKRGEVVTDEIYEQVRFYAFRDLVLDMLFREGFRASGMEENLLDQIVADEMSKSIDQAGSMAAYSAQLEQAGRTIDEETQGLRRFFTSLLYLQMEQGMMPSGKGKGPKARIYVRPSELRNFYERHRERFEREYRVTARMILLREKNGADPAEQRLRAIEARIHSGALDFAEAAREHSDYKASVGGSLGTITPDSTNLPLQQPIRDFLNNASPGDISDPIPVTGGWVLVLAEDVFPGGTAPFDEVQFQILAELMGEHRNELLREALNRLVERCYVWGEGVQMAIESAFPEPEPAPEEESF